MAQVCGAVREPETAPAGGVGLYGRRWRNSGAGRANWLGFSGGGQRGVRRKYRAGAWASQLYVQRLIHVSCLI